TRLSDNKVFSNVTDGTQIDGMQINITGPTAPGDQFMLRPVGNAGVNMTRVLDNPTGIAAASPVTGTVDAANKGTATISSLTVSSQATVPYGNVRIQFTDNAGNYTLSDPTSGVTVSGTWKAGSPISYNGWNLSLNGVPSQNDVINIDATQYPSSNNGNALSILGIRDEDIVGRQLDSSTGIVTPGATLTTAYSQLIGNVGVTVQSAKTSADISSKLSDDTQTLLQNENGVNLDEEAAKMIQYQQSYQASAKVLQVAQSVFQTLLSSLGN
ncbi:MAG TPA: flagellar basal body rod C-terminal domain-containing protein, partial [Aquabacterium sp.]|nr:flagellar basal body rod C-terminal domain-containing protein [Aquabacterium sp.]